MELIRFVLMLGLTLTGRIVERANRFNAHGPDHAFLIPNIVVIYDVLNLNLALGIGGLGLLLAGGTMTATPLLSIVAIIAILLGCVSRGIVSGHQPVSMSCTDPDWLCGVIIPNTVGLGTLLFCCMWSWVVSYFGL